MSRRLRRELERYLKVVARSPSVSSVDQVEPGQAAPMWLCPPLSPGHLSKTAAYVFPKVKHGASVSSCWNLKEEEAVWR